MSSITKNYTFSAGSVIVAAEHNANFDTIYSDYNTNITNVNIAAGAAIVDTKLANITTTGKVALSALTVASQAQGDVIYASSASVWTRLGPGTSGQFLKTQGVAANPIWADALGGTYATQAEMETATSTTTAVSPGRVQNHPGVAKAWCTFNGATTGTNAPSSGYNVDSVTRNSTGNYTITFGTDFSAATYAISGMALRADGAGSTVFRIVSRATGSCVIITSNVSDSADDSNPICLQFFGDQ